MLGLGSNLNPALNANGTLLPGMVLIKIVVIYSVIYYTNTSVASIMIN
jgi:hypothetical protein